tara:strand:- start:4252 stop:5502 length:1251 start_codon:yes stop_codon:yes gene_type:complete
MNRYVKLIGKKAKKVIENKIDTKTKNKVLKSFLIFLTKNEKKILKQNQKDIKFAKKKKLKLNIIDRLTLNSNKLDSIKKSVNDIIKIKDPVNEVLENWKRPNGLNIKKVSTPIGVIGVIYESRPNVTSDISSLCFKSGNAVILRGGSEAINSNKILVALFRKALAINNVNPDFVQFINYRDRKIVDFMLAKMTSEIDVIIPRGGKSLIKRVQAISKIPIIGHLEGICHTYIDKDADLKMATKVLNNAKLRNTSICGATETVLFHEKIVKKFSNIVLKNLKDNNCKIKGDNLIRKFFVGKIYPAKDKDWSTEYLSATISAKCVKNCDEAIKHINKYGTMHTESIITKNKKTAQKFIKNINSSIVMHNTSTQFADGGEFGFGGEVGISTNNLPPRGPVGLKQLISYKYEVYGKGHIRN